MTTTTVNCYTDIGCSSTPTTASSAANCPSGTYAYKTSASNNCLAKNLTFFSDQTCTAGNIIKADFTKTTYRDPTLTNEQIWNLCPGAYGVRDAGSYGCTYGQFIEKGVQCFTDTGCASAFTWVYNTPANCPASTLGYKAQNNGATIGYCTKLPIRCYTQPNGNGVVTMASASTPPSSFVTGLPGCCPIGTTASWTDLSIATPTITNNATCYTTRDCSGTGVYGKDATATLTSCSNVTGVLSAKAAGGTCTVIAPSCFTTADCSGTGTGGTISSTGKVTCPSGSVAFMNANETTCRATAKCYTTAKCTDTPTSVNTSDYLDCKAAGMSTSFIAGISSTSATVPTQSCTGLRSACFTSTDCSGTPMTDTGAIGAKAVNNCPTAAGSFYAGSGTGNNCNATMKCYSNATCDSADFTLGAVGAPDTCGLNYDNKYLYYKLSNGTCVPRVMLLYAADNCSGTTLGAGLKDINSTSGGNGSILNYENNDGIGMYMKVPTSSTSTSLTVPYKSYQMPHVANICKNTASCYSDANGTTEITRGAFADPFTCPPVWNGTKVLSAKGPSATDTALKTLSPCLTNGSYNTCPSSTFGYSQSNFGVNKYYEKNGANTCNGSANEYVRMLFKVTNAATGSTDVRVKCCKINTATKKPGTDCTYDGTAPLAAARLDEDTMLAIPDEAAELEMATEGEFEFEADDRDDLEWDAFADADAAAAELAADGDCTA